MKRNLFAIFLAVMLVAALVFVVAPSAKAADSDLIYLDANGKITITADNQGKILDLQGNKNATVTFEVSAELEVIDTSFIVWNDDRSDYTIDFSGDNAGALTIVNTTDEDGALTKGSVATVSQYGDYRYLAVEKDGKYSFHPFNMAISKRGINVLRKTVSLEAMFIANNVVRDMITDFGVYKHDGNTTGCMSANKSFDAKNGVVACWDLSGSLSADMLPQTRTFSAYIQIEGMKDPILAEKEVDVTPANVLGGVNNAYAAGKYTGETKTLAKMFYLNNKYLRTHLLALEGCVTDGYVMVTDVNDLQVGDKIIIVAKDFKLAMGAQSGNNCAAINIIKNSSGHIANVNNVQIITLEEGKTEGTFAFKVSNGYLYAAASDKNYLKVQSTINENGSFAITIAANGTATVKSTGTYTRNWMRYNDTSNLFSCYGSGQKDIAIYKLGDILACDEHTGGKPTCTTLGYCTNCGAEYGEKLECADTDKDHYCDNGCGNRLSDCGDADSDNACDICGDSMNQGGVPEVLATFAFGANGSATHADGSEKASYTETVNGYTLSATNCTKFYTGARDAKGNSCIKLGTGSAAGSFTFKVPENVTSVNIYIAKYKANTTKVSINNGAAQTLTKNSNNGEYDVITIDTSSVKTITVKSQSGGYRAMVNTIEFVGIAK